jgi:tetratricopeptide (TPR) repeat protein
MWIISSFLGTVFFNGGCEIGRALVQSGILKVEGNVVPTRTNDSVASASHTNDSVAPATRTNDSVAPSRDEKKKIEVCQEIYNKGDFQGTIDCIQRSLPGETKAETSKLYTLLSQSYMCQAKFGLGLNSAQLAYDIAKETEIFNLLMPILLLGSFYYYRLEPEKTITYCKEGLEKIELTIEPNNISQEAHLSDQFGVYYRVYLAACYYQQGNWGEAEKELELAQQSYEQYRVFCEHSSSEKLINRKAVLQDLANEIKWIEIEKCIAEKKADDALKLSEELWKSKEKRQKPPFSSGEKALLTAMQARAYELKNKAQAIAKYDEAIHYLDATECKEMIQAWADSKEALK